MPTPSSEPHLVQDASFRLLEQRPDPLPATGADEEWEDVEEEIDLSMLLKDGGSSSLAWYSVPMLEGNVAYCRQRPREQHCACER